MHGSEIYQQVYTVDRIMKELRGKNKTLLNLFIAKFLVLMQIHLKCCNTIFISQKWCRLIQLLELLDHRIMDHGSEMWYDSKE